MSGLEMTGGYLHPPSPPAAPKGKRMGHAGAIISAFGESASEKVEILSAVGVTVAENPAVIGSTIASVMQ